MCVGCFNKFCGAIDLQNALFNKIEDNYELLVGLYNYVDENQHGIQLGLFNGVCRNQYGMQIGFWNECAQGSLPLINICF